MFLLVPAHPGSPRQRAVKWLLLFFFPYLSFPLRTYPFHFQAKDRKRQPNLGFFRCFSLFCVIVFLCF